MPKTRRATVSRRPSLPGLASQLRQMQLLTRVSSVINSSMEPEEVLRLVVREAVEITQATSGSLALIDPHTQLLEIQTSIGLTPKAQALKLPIGRGVTGWVAKTARPLRVPDVRANPHYIPVRKDIRSELAAPLIVNDELIGVLNVDSVRRAAFSAEDEQLLTALAHHAAQVIHNSWLYAAVALNARRLESLFAVAQSIIASHELEEILQRVVRDACDLMQTKICSLMLLNAAGDRLELHACHGASDDYLRKPPLSVDDSLVGNVVRRRKPVQVYNVQEHDAYQHIELARREGLVSLLSVPMASGDVVIGALSVYTATPYRYSNQDIAILSALGNLAAIAIENARLHARVVTAEEQLRRNERLSTLGLLAAEVAHEIRNPLTVMKMLFHSLDLRFDNADPRVRDAEVMAEKMDHLNRIVDRLLGFARSAEPTLAPLRLNPLLDDLLLLTRHKLTRQHITLHTSLDPNLPLVPADRAQIEQALLNLILNAVDSMTDGGVLTISTTATPDAVTISLTDTGTGMTDEQQRNIFQPFLTTKTGGTGLGLAIVHRIVTEVHRGRIEVESATGRGTTFRLHLPL